ncbi:MAG: hypothetical protein H0X39_02270, partial [Actinobacteria bacterium]|nr:hypothetical protein [Actinomycetota bacterium]
MLLLADTRSSGAGTMLQHRQAFAKYSKHDVSVYDPCGVDHSRFFDLDDFDVVVIHYSITITAEWYLPPWLRRQLREFDGAKILFLQDEYRWIDLVTEVIRELGITVLYSVAPPAAWELLYRERLPDVQILPTLTGYVPSNLVTRRPPPTRNRPVDIGYRGRVLPYWTGALGQEKVSIARGVLERAAGNGLRCDIAWGENDRLYGEKWYRFLESAKATLGTGSGTSISDFDGSVEHAVTSYLAAHPGADFEEVAGSVLAPYEGNVLIDVISPRIFEAAALNTLLVLFPGPYSNAVEPWEHYVPLERDFSNFGQVVEFVRDASRLEQMTRRARSTLIESGNFSLSSFIGRFDEDVDQHADRRTTRRSRRAIALARLERPFVTGTLAGRDVRAGRNSLTRARLTTTLTLRDPELRRLAYTYLSSSRARASVKPRRLARDLLRLGLIRAAHVGARATAVPFSVRPRLDRRGKSLALESVPGARENASGPETIDLGQLLADGATLVWDHRRVGLETHYRRASGRWFGISVGYYGVLGIHHFAALERLASLNPSVVAGAVEPLFRRPPRPRKDRGYPPWVFKVLPRRQSRALIRHQARRPRVSGRRPVTPVAIAMAPRNYAAKAYAVARVTSERPTLAAVLTAWRDSA